ncbi:MAG: aryl-sulfate sulfotransferase, partial [Flavobacteriales bacterium]|nr:aryl-sulfate sulfotransferase [Flavobacteriales bacterium]
TLVGDNVLLTAWEVKTATEVNDAGFDNSTTDKWPTHFIELADDGNGGATIVWERHIWDHLIQDTDASKPNYGVVSDNPQLIDINMIAAGGGPPGGGGGGDWFHVNGVDYNEELDQIAFSSRHASEIYIIDHSTTTAQAASHAGGNSGMGGDIMYRWGNPSNYGMPGTQVIPNAVHDARWITNDGRPNGGFLQIFNNSGVSNNVSAIDGIETSWDSISNSYLRNPGQAFEPISYTTRYECAYSASGQSSSDRMSNGNIYVNASSGQGGSGVMYEVDMSGNIIWGPYQAATQKGFRYECDYPGILALEPFINSSTSSCFSSVNIDEINSDFSVILDHNNSSINVSSKHTSFLSADILVYNMLGQEIYNEKITSIGGFFYNDVDLRMIKQGIYIVKLFNNNKQLFSEKIAF